jgi:hypothetical protein
MLLVEYVALIERLDYVLGQIFYGTRCRLFETPWQFFFVAHFFVFIYLVRHKIKYLKQKKIEAATKI